MSALSLEQREIGNRVVEILRPLGPDAAAIVLAGALYNFTVRSSREVSPDAVAMVLRYTGATEAIFTPERH
jgi:hypothetical protein